MPQRTRESTAIAERDRPERTALAIRPHRGAFAMAAAVSAATLLLLLTPTVAAAPADPITPGTSGTVGLEGVPHFSHVFVIVGENTGYDQVNQHNAPYLTGTVAPESAWLTQYYGVTHYSLSNYVAMTSGQFTSCEQADGSPAACHQNVENLFHQLDANGTSWTSWVESMPAPCYLANAGSDANLSKYAPKHNPAVYFDDIEGPGGVFASNQSQVSTECQTNDVPMGGTSPDNVSAFNAALAAGSVSAFNYVVPNICEDAHDKCTKNVQRVTQFDDFLAAEVPRITSSPAWDNASAVFITFDEGVLTGTHYADKHDNGGRVVFAVISPMVKAGTYSTTFDHYSLLRTLEDGYGISTYLGNATSASPMSEIWG